MRDDALLWTHKPPKRVPKPGEKLFEFVRASDGAPITIERRFHGQSYGWEVQVLKRGEIFAHGAWVTRAAAIAWAEHALEPREIATRLVATAY